MPHPLMEYLNTVLRPGQTAGPERGPDELMERARELRRLMDTLGPRHAQYPRLLHELNTLLSEWRALPPADPRREQLNALLAERGTGAPTGADVTAQGRRGAPRPGGDPSDVLGPPADMSVEEFNRRAGRAFRKARASQFQEIEQFIVENKLVPKSLDEVKRAARAMASIDRDELAEAPGTLIPELLLSLTVLPGAVQAFRDVVMDVRANDTGWLTVLAGMGAIPLIGPIAKGLRSGKQLGREAHIVHAIMNANPNGFSFDPRTGGLLRVGTDEGVMVGVRGRAVDFNDPQDVEKFLRENASALNRDNVYLGGWRDSETGKVWLDVAERHPTRASALRRAGTREKAVFDLKSGEEIANPNFDPHAAEGAAHATEVQGQMATDFDRLRAEIEAANAPTDDVGRANLNKQVDTAVRALRGDAPAPVADVPTTPARIEPSPAALERRGQANELETLTHDRPLADLSVDELVGMRARAFQNARRAEATLAAGGEGVIGSTNPALYDLQRLDETLRGKGFQGPLLTPSATARAARGADDELDRVLTGLHGTEYQPLGGETYVGRPMYNAELGSSVLYEHPNVSAELRGLSDEELWEKFNIRRVYETPAGIFTADDLRGVAQGRAPKPLQETLGVSQILPAALTAAAVGGTALAGDQESATLAGVPLPVPPNIARGVSRAAREVDAIAAAANASRGAAVVPGAAVTPEHVQFLRQFPAIARRVADAPNQQQARTTLDEAMANYAQFRGKVSPLGPQGPVFHGTTTEFDVFEKTQDLGFHFGTRGAAEGRARQLSLSGGTLRGLNAPPRIKEFHLRLENPLEMDDLGVWHPSQVLDELSQRGVLEGGTDISRRMFDFADNYALDRHPEFAGTGQISPEYSATHRRGRYKFIQNLLKEQGFDGIVYRNIGEPSIGGRRVASGDLTMPRPYYVYGDGTHAGSVDDLDNSYIVFDPTQIKSSKNVGIFGLNNPNVHLGIGMAAGLGTAALDDKDIDGLTNAGWAIVGAGGRINPQQVARAARRIGRSAREVERIIETAQAPRVRAIMEAMTDDELARIGRSRASAEGVVRAAGELDDPAVLAQAALAGESARGGYRRTAEYLNNAFGPDAPVFAAMMASLSPQAPLDRNVQNALKTFEAWHVAGRPTGPREVDRFVGGLPAELQMRSYAPNIRRVLTSAEDPERLRGLMTSGQLLSGGKVASFGPNLLGDVERVTLDTWLARLQGMDPRSLPRKSQVGELPFRGEVPSGEYDAYAAQIRRTSDYLSRRTGATWTPEMVQEAAWGWTKDLVENSPGGAMIGLHPVPGPVPLGKRVTLTDPERIRQAWDVPEFILRDQIARTIMDRLDVSPGGLRGEAPGRAPARFPRADMPAPDEAALRGLAQRRITPALRGQFALGGAGLLGANLLREDENETPRRVAGGVRRGLLSRDF